MKKISTIFIMAAGVAALNSSCSSEKMEDFLHPMVKAPASTIERDVKGHDQIYSVQVILRLATKRSDGKSYSAYGLSYLKNTALPLYQEIDLSKDDNGNITITSQRKAFDVVKSSKCSYALELKYFDLNNKLINHQFAHYDERDPENSTLLHHQHFFSLHNYSLNGQQLVFPMTLDSVYLDKYLFQTEGQNDRIPSSVATPVSVYVPTDDVSGKLKYDYDLAQRAIEKTMKAESTNEYLFPKTGRKYRLYKALPPTKLNEKVPEIFSYIYRDTDPVEEYLYNRVKGNDDLNRVRVGKDVCLLQQKRDLSSVSNFDHLGFKGILQFKLSNVAFQMRICISHMITATEKYYKLNGLKGINGYNEISPSWNTYDIDYPIAFRVIADADGDQETFFQDMKKVYPSIDRTDLEKIFNADADYFRHIPQVTM